MKIAVIGTGYVGLTTSAVFAELGNEVYGVDIDQAKIEGLKKGKIPFFEPTLPEYVLRNQKSNRLFFSTDYKEAVKNAQVIFICVGTPPQQSGEANLDYVFEATAQVAKNLTDYAVIVIKSTVPMAIDEDLKKIISQNTKFEFDIASCPEFLKEGTAIEDSFNPDRVVIGTDNKKAQKILLELHEPIPGERVLCDIRSAQLIKYASNSFLATKISFVNALSQICEKSGANIKDVALGIGLDKRIGKSFLNAGLGYGGSCLPKDVSAFINFTQKLGHDFELLKAVEGINVNQSQFFVQKIIDNTSHDKNSLDGVKLAILGLAFKPNTDDIREAPSIKVITRLLELKAQISVYDPQASENFKKLFPQVHYAKDPYEACDKSDALVIITEWPEFKQMDLERVKKQLNSPVIIDGRNIFEKNEVEGLGFKYIGIGI